MAGLESYRFASTPSENDKWWEKSSDWRHDNMNSYHPREVIRPLEVPVMHPLAEDNPPSDDDIMLRTYIGGGCALATLIIENLVEHPLLVLRRQCQVNPVARKYHIIPVTLIPVMMRLHQTQGLNVLWKGMGSVLLVRGMSLAIEDLISKITPWPKQITCNCSLKSFGQHILLKCVSIGLVTPFFSASLVETVQSEIASERPGIFDVFRDGAIRLVEVSNKGRLIPIYSLLPPTVCYYVTKYLVTLIVKGVASRIMHIKHKHSQEVRGAYSRDFLSEAVEQDIELKSTVVSFIVSDVMLYPAETVLYRLHLQGTRTIIDNLDTGRSVTPLLTGYSGVRDCYSTIIATEGPLGLYKGFGALILQFTIEIMLIKAVKWILIEFGTMMRRKPKSKEPRDHRTHYNNM